MAIQAKDDEMAMKKSKRLPRHAYGKYWLKKKLGCIERLKCSWCEDWLSCLDEYIEKAYRSVGA